ncbi:hypothetical protein FN846DRAFT_905230 [Sphaerosporella brunnea]|uniref:Uncharacterized protein n=1 Tax=Sphaerosporella brunnea TaxID=1250544 RepID=A0A5J5F1Z7_9PEZI|nr:hypothetical protein FN846DRAFT_905230 [Sphaerosporella brunnea]
MSNSDDAYYTSLNSQDMSHSSCVVTNLCEHHTACRAQNDAVVKAGLAMEARLKPIEDGLRIEKEAKAAEEAAECSGGGAAGDEPTNEEVSTVAAPAASASASAH